MIEEKRKILKEWMRICDYFCYDEELITCGINEKPKDVHGWTINEDGETITYKTEKSVACVLKNYLEERGKLTEQEILSLLNTSFEKIFEKHKLQFEKKPLNYRISDYFDESIKLMEKWKSLISVAKDNKERLPSSWEYDYDIIRNYLSYLNNSKKRFINVDTSVIQKDHFPKLLSREKIVNLFKFLVDKGFISKETKENDFLYLFGCDNVQQHNKIKAIEWIATKQLARELLIGIYKDEIKRKEIKLIEIERLTPVCFFKSGTPMKLAKNKVIPSTQSDELTEFLETL